MSKSRRAKPSIALVFAPDQASYWKWRNDALARDPRDPVANKAETIDSEAARLMITGHKATCSHLITIRGALQRPDARDVVDWIRDHLPPTVTRRSASITE